MDSRISRATDGLYKAIAKYVEVHGGSVVVAGDIQIAHDASDLKYNWTISARCTGRPPIRDIIDHPDIQKHTP